MPYIEEIEKICLVQQEKLEMQIEEGVEFIWLTSPKKFIGEKKVTGGRGK